MDKVCLKFVKLASIALLINFAETASTYDQSQSGDLNVQVDLNNVNIIALMKSGKEEYVDYDYAYDYSEMTIKPQNGATSKPLNATISNQSDNITITSTFAPIISTTVISEITTASFGTTIQANITDNVSYNITNIGVESSNITSNVVPTTVSSGCKKGFAVNQKGDCELRLQTAGTNALLKLVKLSQKLKLRREEREQAKLRQ